MSSYDDDDRPPVIAEPVRRDPTLGFRDRDTPFEAPPVDEHGQPRTGRRPDWYMLLALSVCIVCGAFAALVLLGVSLHGLYRVIMLGWNLI